LLPYILFEKYIYILALEMASPENQHCVNCIGTLSFPMRSIRSGLLSNFIHQRLAEKKNKQKQ